MGGMLSLEPNVRRVAAAGADIRALRTPPTLMSLLALCGVPTAEHGKWVDTRNRLSIAPGASASRLKAQRGDLGSGIGLNPLAIPPRPPRGP